MATESTKDLVHQFFGKTSDTYDTIVNLTTFGRDSYWKEKILQKITACDSVLDLACGTGILTFKIAKKFRRATIIGVDVTKEYLRMAKSKIKPHHKILFLLDDAERLSLGTKFDCITSSYIPKYCVPDTLIERCISHLNPHGKIIFHDFTYPKSKTIRFLWNLYFSILQTAGVFLPSWKDVFENLPKLIRSSEWVNKFKDAMEKNGLKADVEYLTLGCSAILTGTKNV